MTRRAIYVTHPEVQIDPNIATPDWGLSDVGAQRISALCERITGLQNAQVFSSAERKALETAWPLASQSGRGLIVKNAMGENDRSATGFLDQTAFLAARDAFFGAPATSFQGWETAQDAQSRIVKSVRKAIQRTPMKNLVFAGHGAVGTLLFCHLSQQSIDVKWDQNGGGHWFAFDPDTGAPEHHWRPIEALDHL